MKCKDVDIIYIALPHSLHHRWVIKSIEEGKNILVEKPATLNFLQMENIINNLKDKNIFFFRSIYVQISPSNIKSCRFVKK